MSTEGETLQVSVLPYRCTIFQHFVGACQQRERHSKFLSYLTGARYFNISWEHVNRWRDTPSFCPTLQVHDISTFRGSMSTEGETLHVSVLPYRCTIFQPLVTRQMSNLAILANSKAQNASLFPVHAMFRHDCPLAVKLASTTRRLPQKKKLKEILYPLICSFLLCLSWLLRNRVRKFRRDLWITLYIFLSLNYFWAFETG